MQVLMGGQLMVTGNSEFHAGGYFLAGQCKTMYIA